MNTITKEWLQQAINDYESVRDELPFGLDDYQGKILAALRIAQASLEAEPVAYADPQAFRNFQAGVARREWMWRNPGEDLIPVYTAPPAPVSLTEEQRAMLRDMDDEIVAELEEEERVCRAAMLQGGKS